MKFTQNVTLIGVVGKKGAGELDNGQKWETDRVELHVITPFPESDSMAHGSTVTCYQVQDYAKNYQDAKALVHQEVVLHLFMQPAKKLGQVGKIICEGFSPVKQHKQAS